MLTAVSPLEHCLLTVEIGVVMGIPALSAAIRAVEAPPEGGRTLPTMMGSEME